MSELFKRITDYDAVLAENLPEDAVIYVVLPSETSPALIDRNIVIGNAVNNIPKSNGVKNANLVAEGTPGPHRIIFTSSGSWTCPAGVTQILVNAVGKGGNGANGNPGIASGGGGGSGAWCREALFTVVPGTTYTVTISTTGTSSFGTLLTLPKGGNGSGVTGGAGASAGTGSNAGYAGGTSFPSASCGGGGGGGIGGTGSIGNNQISGGGGGSGSGADAYQQYGGSGGGGYLSGLGGNGFLNEVASGSQTGGVGAGGAGGAEGTTPTIVNGYSSIYGGGGGGGGAWSVGTTGGAGGPAIIIIEY